MVRKRIAVVGAGLGGLSAAARLASAGHHVEVFESQLQPGGKAGSRQLGEYRFDTGPSLVTMPDVFDQLFKETGGKREDYIRFAVLDEICRYFFEDGSKLNSYSDSRRFAEEVAAKTDDSSDALHRFLEYSRRIYSITSDLFLKKSLHELGTYTNRRAFASIMSLGKIDAFRTMDRSIRSYFRDPRMIQFFDRYATYNGSNPYKTPGTLNIIPHVEYGSESAATQPVAATDGIHSIPRGMAELARDRGAIFHFGTKVEKIRYAPSTRRITGVVVDGAALDFDVVVSNADVFRTYTDLLTDQKARRLKRYSRLEPSSSGLVFFWGMNDTHPELGLHNIFFSSDYTREFADIFDHQTCPVDPTVYVNITAKVTRGDAPHGGENWFVLINAPYEAGQNWTEETARTRAAVIHRLSTTLGRDIEKTIEVESVMTPLDIEAQTGSRFGSLYGISSNSRMAAFMRHPNRSRRYPGLFFCGGSAHPGGGMPLVVLSGKIASDLIQREFGRGRL